MLRRKLQTALKAASEQADERATAVLRLVLAAIHERDRRARDAGGGEAVGDAEIEGLLREMVAEREAEIARCESRAWLERAEQEAREIAILRSFLPARLGEAEIRAAVDEAIRAVGASKLKDAGKVIGWLKERHDGRVDFALVRRILRERLH
ncbi:MAG: GatB/YqeY domain-containing protein [Geminicoccaceae bacterium]|nr:GatB/YqeY domain-containing protein [Geminicoccaceae bacterium]MCS7266484.1 GatB/YqeY domain-containing protein [Geminicoccaceae bacterium]MCX7631327.1 GatB/YqeY domain-containing protein [Geminicoccaceae bacterium]MDW8123920.1 GatB/YqeY domain-containing protein [Geminicoccaceae bacterium]MDW8340017.1 GatB/YqeY domain-containing protein [Geminicoccaceae bacterium]